MVYTVRKKRARRRLKYLLEKQKVAERLLLDHSVAARPPEDESTQSGHQVFRDELSYRSPRSFASMLKASENVTDNVHVEDLIEEVKKRPALWDNSLPESKNRSIKYRAWGDICSALLEHFSQKTILEKENIQKKLLTKWHAIRDNYVKHKRKEQSELDEARRTGAPLILPPRYIYADNLTFLDHSISLQASADSSDVEEIVKEHPESEEIVFKEEKIDFEEDPNFSEPSIKKEPILEEPSTWQDDPCSSSTAACDPLPDRESPETTFQPQGWHQETVDSEPGGKRRRVEDVNGDAAFFESLLPLMKGFDSQKRLRFRMHVMSALARFCDPNYSHSESD
ncbi:unnamed protein product [Bemisia tabaci]|uniref:MADF domain-containing protein n=1 Tax=Bemisia tabaci TaxID=7038 RepID=A0A9P0AN71_BEMTA|nr:unnamed protein product [Bemisia tabaci]